MKFKRTILCFAAAALCNGQTPKHPEKQSISVSISEPGSSDLKAFFSQADSVFLVQVLAGDTETYKQAVFKARIVETFKGKSKAGDVIYYGHFIGVRVGNEYLLFLKNPLAQPLGHKNTPLFGEVHPYRVMREGYGGMEVAYSCGFNIGESCDDSIRVCTDNVHLPEGVPVSSEVGENTPFGCRWFRKNSILNLLLEFAK